MAEQENNEREEIYSKAVRAGKRTYFFDVKATRGNDYYLTITESKKYFEDDKPFYKKHKLFLYKEDFDKFMEGLNETVDYIRKNQGSAPAGGSQSAPSQKSEEATGETEKFSDLNFEDLGSEDEGDKS